MLVILADSGVDTANVALSSGISAVVAILAFVLAGIAFLSQRRRGNSGLRWVGFAFIVFGVKNVFSAVMVQTHIIRHDDIELTLSVLDFAILLLLFMPLVFRRRA